MTNPSPTPSGAGEHRSVSRAVAMLELVAARDPEGVRLGDLASAIGAPKSSAHGIAKGLVAVGYLAEVDDRYLIGPAIYSLLGSRLPAFPAAFHSALEDLVNQWGETAFLATLVGDSSVYVDCVNSPHFIRAAPPMNTRVPLWPRSAGKCFLAWMEPRQIDLILRRGGHDVGEMESIKAQLAEVRSSGVGLNLSESAPDMIGMASPILSVRRGPVTMAIAMGGPESRMKPHLNEMTESLRETASALGRLF
jgi:DNA-binding IclR family transcriptional regulator